MVGPQKGRRKQQLSQMAAESGIPVRTASAKAVANMTGTEQHQGIAARVSLFPLTDITTLLDRVRFGSEPPLVLVMDQLTDTRNLGALSRSALCVGVQAMVLPKDRAVQPTAAASKASAGALEHMVLARVTNLSRTLALLKETGLWVTGLDQRAAETIYTADLTGPLALVVGGEDKGIRPLVKRQCDRLVRIPQQGPVSSLNASTAGTVVMYEIYRQRLLKTDLPA